MNRSGEDFILFPYNCILCPQREKGCQLASEKDIEDVLDSVPSWCPLYPVCGDVQEPEADDQASMKTATWLKGYFPWTQGCSNCFQIKNSWWKWNYCPNCGAKMSDSHVERREELDP